MDARTACLWSCLALFPPAQDDAPVADGHQRMIALLDELLESALEENSYVGTGTERQLLESLASLPPEAPDKARAGLLFQLGEAQLRLGKEVQAVEAFTQARAIVEAHADCPLELQLEVTMRLGVAHLRRGETENCCNRYTPESCVFPIQGGGIHQVREPSERARELFVSVVKRAPPGSATFFAAQWLLHLAVMTLGEYPEGVPAEYRIAPEVFQSRIEFPRFENIAARLGVDTKSLAGGAVAEDFDGDDRLDLIVTTMHPAGQMRYFHNEGDGTFADRTEEAGLLGLRGGLNCIQADHDNDGDMDVLVLRGGWFGPSGRHPNSLLRNAGDGTFEDVTFAAGLGEVHYPTQTAAFADYDGDGDLDLYVGNEFFEGMEAPCQLFRNQGDGTFEDVAAAAGVENRKFTKAVVFGDYDGDSDPDLYVSNYADRNALFRNNGDGTFTDVAESLGVAEPVVSFPAWFWDHDNDGVLDLLVTAYEARIEHVCAELQGIELPMERNRLYRGRGDGTFEDVATEKGLRMPSAPMGSNFGDLNGDGWLDFYLGTGRPNYAELTPNVMYLSVAGKRFENVSTAGGFGNLQKGHAVVFADFDNDGDQDVFEQMGGAYAGDEFADSFYENPGFGTHALTVKLVGVETNRCAVGARIRVDFQEGTAERSVYRTVGSGGSFGGNPLRQFVGLGTAERVRRLQVFWPTSGKTQEFADVPADVLVTVVEGQDELHVQRLPALDLGGSAPRGTADPAGDSPSR